MKDNFLSKSNCCISLLFSNLLLSLFPLFSFPAKGFACMFDRMAISFADPIKAQDLKFTLKGNLIFFLHSNSLTHPPTI